MPDSGFNRGVHLQSLNLLTCTEGKAPSLPEYTKLLQRAGFTGVEGRRTLRNCIGTNCV